jgi:hypothetical protein
LNRDRLGTNKSFEILNFASDGYRPICQLTVLNEEALSLNPNALFYVGHDGDAPRLAMGIAVARRNGIQPGDPFLKNVLERAGIDRDTVEPVVLRKLRPFGDEVLKWLYDRIVTVCKEHEIEPFFIYMPTLVPVEDTTNMRMPAAAGFTLIDLSGVYDGHPRESIEIAEWDQHPNAAGHQLIAERLYTELQQKKLIRIPQVERILPPTLMSDLSLLV